MKYIAMALVVLLISVAVLAEDGFTLAFWPNIRAPSASIAGTHTFDLDLATFALGWAVGAWMYIDPPPKGYGPLFYVFDLTPSFSLQIGGWTVTVGSLFQYRTNLPDKSVIAPEISFFHSW